jgi:periodic tryptophan protein 1
VLWHPSDGWLLSSGSFDRSVSLIDCRTSEQVGKWTYNQDVESMVWNPTETNQLYCALEDGMVSFFF